MIKIKNSFSFLYHWHQRIGLWQNRPVYRIHSDQGVAYFSATDLTPIEHGEKRYADFMARHYLGDSTAPVIDATPIEQFDSDYLYINRYLPVMRVNFERTDNARVYRCPTGTIGDHCG